jgi:hypothetical protein
MENPDGDWIERELLLFLDRVRRWVFFIGLAVLLICALIFIQTILQGFGGSELLMSLVPLLLFGFVGAFLIATARKASESFDNRKAIKPTLRYLLSLFQIVGVLFGLYLVAAVIGFFQFVRDF